jgi:hypothetical protein
MSPRSDSSINDSSHRLLVSEYEKWNCHIIQATRSLFVFHLHWVQLSILCYLCSEKSGHGILEFSTEKAGQDVTPLNLEFGEEDKAQHRSSGGALNSITGIFCATQLITWHVLAPLTEAKLCCIYVSVLFASLNIFTWKCLAMPTLGDSCVNSKM